MLVLFMDRYNEEIQTRNCYSMHWDELPLPIRESIADAMSSVITQVKDDMY
jgi:hypothetical protein